MFVSAATRKVLAASGIEVPRTEAYADVLWRYWRERASKRLRVETHRGVRGYLAALLPGLVDMIAYEACRILPDSLTRGFHW